LFDYDYVGYKDPFAGPSKSLGAHKSILSTATTTMAKGSNASHTVSNSSTNQQESILPLFPLLSSHDQPTRLDASVSLLTSLPLGKSSTTSEVPTDVSYTIKRLVTGLGSANEAAREGFAVALAELISLLPIERARTILPLVLETSIAPGSADGKEERNLLFGRLFGLHALVRSGVLLHQEQPDSEQYKDTVLALLALSGRKSWMREPATWAIVEAVRALVSATPAPAWKQEACEWLVQRLLNDPREKARGWTPDKVALVLVMQQSGMVSSERRLLPVSVGR
jgi:DNA polymerase phi